MATTLVRSRATIEHLRGLIDQRERLNLKVRMNFTGNGAHNNDAHSAPFRPFADGKFYTASGKAELYSENVKAMGLDPVARFVPLRSAFYFFHLLGAKRLTAETGMDRHDQ